MRDRAKILVGNREVAKRYIGSRLMWENNSSLILELKGARIWKYWGGYNIDIGDNRIDVRRIKYVEVDGNLVKLNGEASSFQPRTVYIDSQKSFKNYDGNYDVKFYDKNKEETT
ncbi:hypothetical protein [uncultured Streptococcus sp.]|uniref:hypothetical protein n=1 Tax=uncultured Streptococcus sp. TaxID=83427 RepID=UPI0028D316EC|nr:hypothetical protein [uncultured Streptococcus sp.]